MNSILMSIVTEKYKISNENPTINEYPLCNSPVIYEHLPPAPPMFNSTTIKDEVAKLQNYLREVKYFDTLLNNITEHIKKSLPVYKGNNKCNKDTYMIPIAISNLKTVIILLNLIGY